MASPIDYKQPANKENEPLKKKQPSKRKKLQPRSSKELACLNCRPKKIKVTFRKRDAKLHKLTLTPGHSAKEWMESVKDAGRSILSVDFQNEMSVECMWKSALPFRPSKMY